LNLDAVGNPSDALLDDSPVLLVVRSLVFPFSVHYAAMLLENYRPIGGWPVKSFVVTCEFSNRELGMN
jgi:hypothetical protein